MSILAFLAQEAASTALPSNQIILPPTLPTVTETPWASYFMYAAMTLFLAVAAAVTPYVARAFGALAQRGLLILEGWLKVRQTDQIQAQINDITMRSVAYADEWAHNEKNKGRAPTGDDKMEQALSFAKEQIATFKVDEQNGKFIEKMIQATIGAKRESVAVKVAEQVSKSIPPAAPVVVVTPAPAEPPSGA